MKLSQQYVEAEAFIRIRSSVQARCEKCPVLPFGTVYRGLRGFEMDKNGWHSLPDRTGMFFPCLACEGQVTNPWLKYANVELVRQWMAKEGLFDGDQTKEIDFEDLRRFVGLDEEEVPAQKTETKPYFDTQLKRRAEDSADDVDPWTERRKQLQREIKENLAETVAVDATTKTNSQFLESLGVQNPHPPIGGPAVTIKGVIGR